MIEKNWPTTRREGDRAKHTFWCIIGSFSVKSKRFWYVFSFNQHVFNWDIWIPLRYLHSHFRVSIYVFINILFLLLDWTCLPSPAVGFPKDDTQHVWHCMYMCHTQIAWSWFLLSSMLIYQWPSNHSQNHLPPMTSSNKLIFFSSLFLWDFFLAATRALTVQSKYGIGADLCYHAHCILFYMQ